MPVLSVHLIVAGILLVLAEFAVPGFVICFFGAAAIATGLVHAVFQTMSGAALVSTYIILTLAFVFGVRRFIPASFKGRVSSGSGDPDDDGVAGSHAVVAEAIAPDAPGKVDFRGSLWTASSDRAIHAGERVEIIRRNNLELIVK